jgi:L-fucose isomerase-like protein
VASPSSENNLTERYYVTLIVRLMVDHHGQLIHGEMVDATNTFRERFIGRHGLIDTMQTWLTRQERGGADGPQTLE